MLEEPPWGPSTLSASRYSFDRGRPTESWRSLRSHSSTQLRSPSPVHTPGPERQCPATEWAAGRPLGGFLRRGFHAEHWGTLRVLEGVSGAAEGWGPGRHSPRPPLDCEGLSLECVFPSCSCTARLPEQQAGLPHVVLQGRLALASSPVWACRECSGYRWLSCWRRLLGSASN